MPQSRLFSIAAVFSLSASLAVAAQDTQQPSVPPPAAAGAGAAGISAGAINASTMRGTITDPDQAVIPGATITLQPAKGKALIQQSGADGAYELKNIPTGAYTITVTMSGFATVVRQNVKFAAGQVMKMDVKMAIETEATEVNVTTTTNQVSVDPDSNASSVVIKGKDLDALSDDPDELSSELSALAGPSAGPNGGQIYVDGFTGGQLPPKSSIREIRVNQNPFSAQYDRPGYGRVEILTKPGTDSFHGNAMIMGNHSSFNTRNPFLGNASFPPYYQIFSMAGLNGPIRKGMSFTVNGSYRDTEDNSVVTGGIISTGPNDQNLCDPGNLSGNCQYFQHFPTQFAANPVQQIRKDLSPRIDIAIGEKNTLTTRYQFEGSSDRNRAAGGTTLPTYRSNSDSSEHEIQIGDSMIVSSKVVNETRFEWRHNSDSLVGVNPNNLPTISIQGTLTGGYNGNNSHSSTDRYELQNYTSVALAKNFIRMGGRWRYYNTTTTSNSGTNGTFVYSAISANSAAGTPAYTAIEAYLANRPSQLNITQINNANIGITVGDIGLYLEDDWKVKPNLTISGGIRYEAQTKIHSARDLAPRVSVAYGIPRKTGNPVTVIRLGAGIFYDRFDDDNILTTARLNGINQVSQIYTLNSDTTSNTTCSPLAFVGCGTGNPQAATKYILDPNGLRSEYNMQFAAGVDQQLAKTASLSVNFISSNGNHAYLSRSFGTRTTGFTQVFASAGEYRQQQIIANTRWNPSPKFSVFGYYVFSHAMANSNSAGSFATDPYNSRTDYGPAGFNRTHRLFLFGNISLPWSMSAGPFIMANSGQPYNIVTGTDVNGDGQFNDRAAFANNRTSGNCTNINDFAPVTDPVYRSGNNYQRVPAYFCHAQATASFNLRLSKSFGFGQKKGADGGSGSGGERSGRSRSSGSMGGGPGGSHSSRGSSSGGPMGMSGGGGNHKYNFNLGAQAFNLFNMVPYSAPQGNLSNVGTFGQPLSLQASGFSGSSNSAVRRIFLQLSFSF